MKKALKYSLAFFFSAVVLVGPTLVKASIKIDDPLGINQPGVSGVPQLANRLIQAMLGVSGVLALLSFIYGGFLYMLAGVNPENVKKGKEIMKWSVAGLMIIFFSYAIVTFLLTTVLGVK